MPTKSYRSFLSFAAPDELVQKIVDTIKTQGKKELNKGNISRLELRKQGYRHDFVIGDLYLIPDSVCNKSENFPSVLLASGVLSRLDQEEKIDAKMGLLDGEYKIAKDTLKLAKEMLFTDSEGKPCDLVAFQPAWGNISDIRVMPICEDTLFTDIRDQVLSAPFNPSLSSAFEQVQAVTGAYRVQAIPLQQSIVTLKSEDVCFPEMTKGSEQEETGDTKIKMSEIETSKSIGDEARKALDIKKTFKMYASKLVQAESTNVSKIRINAAHIEEIEQDIMEPEELALFKQLDEVIDTKVAAATGLRRQPDYGEAGSKETVGPEMVDGPDPKKTAEEEAKVLVEMPASDFIDEHERLVDVLEHGSDAEQFEEGVEQGQELDNVEKDLHMASETQIFSLSDRIQGWRQRSEEISKFLEAESNSNLKAFFLDGLVPTSNGEGFDNDYLVLAPDQESAKAALVSYLSTDEEENNDEFAAEYINELPNMITDSNMFPFEGELRNEELGNVGKTSSGSEEAPIDSNDWFDYEVDEQTEEAKTADVNKVAFTLMVPGQVLEGFYPELAEQLQIQPTGREYDHAPTPDMLQQSLTKEDEGDATKSPAGIGLGPSQPQGAPLRKELNLRGPGFTNMFYAPHDDIEGSSLLMASKTASAEDKSGKLAAMLKQICGQIASSLVAGFQVTQKPLFTDVPMEWSVRLNDVEKGIELLKAGALPVDQTGFGFKFLAESLNDTEITAALNDAWAQAAVWNDTPEGGFTYEVFVRAENLSIEDMILKVKYVIKNR